MNLHGDLQTENEELQTENQKREFRPRRRADPTSPVADVQSDQYSGCHSGGYDENEDDDGEVADEPAADENFFLAAAATKIEEADRTSQDKKESRESQGRQEQIV